MFKNIKNTIGEQFLKYWFSILVAIFGFLVYLPFYYQFSYDLGSSSILSEDQQAYISNLFKILYPQKINKEYWGNFLIFAYGPLFWIFPALIALPFRLINFEPGILLAIYFVPFACLSGIAYILVLIYKKINLSRENLFYKIPAAFSLIVCLLSPVILGNSLQIRAEIVLSFFSILSFYYLILDDNSFQRNYYLSIIFFIILVCIKLLSIFIGVIFLLYYISNQKKLTFKILLNSFYVASLIFLISYTPLWLFGNISHYIDSIAYYSSISLTGWPQDHIIKSYANSVVFFNKIYFNFYALCILLGGVFAIIVNQFKNLLKKDIYLISAFTVVFIYLIYTIFFVFLPNNYGIIIPIFTAALIILMFKAVSNISNNWVKNFAIIAIYIFFAIATYDLIKDKRWNFFNTGLSPYQENVMKAQNNVKDYLTYYSGKYHHPCIDKQLSILKINNTRIPYSSFGELSLNDEMLFKCDIFIFWDESRVSSFLTAKNVENEAIRNTQINYQKVLNKDNFELIYDENKIRIFKKKNRLFFPKN